MVDNTSYILFNPGPVNLDKRVRQAAISIDLCHRQDEFINILEFVKNKLRKIAGKFSSNVSVLQGGGTLAIEAAAQSLLSGRVFCLNNGPYCYRIMNSLINRGVHCKAIDVGLGGRFDLDEVENKLSEGYDWLTLVHHETATGVLNPLGRVCDIAQRFGTKVFVDAVSSFGGHYVDNRANVICTNSNKCLESIPGCSIVIWDEMPCRDGIADCLDISNYSNGVFSTLNTNAVVALETALDIFFAEDRYKRYENRATAVRRCGSTKFPLFLSSGYSNVLTTFYCNDYEALKSTALGHGFVIYSGPTPNTFRVANMGVKINEEIIKELFACLPTK